MAWKICDEAIGTVQRSFKYLQRVFCQRGQRCEGTSIEADRHHAYLDQGESRS